MSWLDALLDRGNEAWRDLAPAARKLPSEPAPEVKTVWVQVRSPRGSDPGEAAPGFYSVADGVLTMRTEKGAPVGKPHPLAQDDNPGRIAARLTRETWLKSRGEGDFNRPLNYQRVGLA